MFLVVFCGFSIVVDASVDVEALSALLVAAKVGSVTGVESVGAIVLAVVASDVVGIVVDSVVEIMVVGTVVGIVVVVLVVITVVGGKSRRHCVLSAWISSSWNQRSFE